MYLLKGGKVLTMAGKNYEKADVLIGDGKILDVGEEIIAPLDAEVIDVSGLTVMPGMMPSFLS